MATGLSISSTSNLSKGQKILVAAAKMAFEAAAPNPDLVMNERIPQGHKQWDVLTYARLSDAAALTEGTDYTTVQQLVAAHLSITPSEHGLIVTLSDRLVRRQGDTNLVASAGAMMANSMRRTMDKDVIALYDGFSKSAGGAGTALDITHFRGSVAYLMTDNDSGYGPAQPPLHAALHIEQISDIIADISDAGTAAGARPAGFGDELLQRWWKGTDRLYAVPIFHAGNIAVTEAGTGETATKSSKGAIFAKDALHLVMANEADVMEDKDLSLRATEYGIFQEWGEGERADPHGVEILSDTSPTI